MKKTFITKMPDKSGAFLEASRIIADAEANITRVSYNKAVDTHTLFIDVAGTEAQLNTISEKLRAIGYIQNHDDDAKVMLLEFLLKDVPGAVLPVLELISRYHFNISYITSQENGTEYQNFKMGLFIENPDAIKRFLNEASRLCEIQIVDYDESEKVLDNTVFYMGFVNRMVGKLLLDREKANELMTQSNLIMQMLEDRDEPPYKTFDYIGKFADMLAQYKGEKFKPEISKMPLKDGFEMYCIQPPCGSNTYILHKNHSLLFVDSGFACYKMEMYRVFLALFPDFDSMHREIMISHPDMDHCGLLNMFETVYVCRTAWEHFKNETVNEPNFREKNPAHAPYCRISRILSKYQTPDLEGLRIVEQENTASQTPVRPLGKVEFEGKVFDFYEGNGGHADGEVIIADEMEKMVFTGDIMVNIQGFSKPQAAFNRLAPYLMTSVNMDSAKAAVERKWLLDKFNPEEYIYCCGHGAIMDQRRIRKNSPEKVEMTFSSENG